MRLWSLPRYNGVMEESPEKTLDTNPERTRYLEELGRMLEEIKPQALSGVLKVEHKIGGGLKDSQELISGIEPQHTVLDEQKESALLEDELLPPTSEVDMMALEKVRRNIPEYLKPRQEVSPHSVRMYSFPIAERPAISKAVEIKKEFKFKDIETAIINFLRGKTLVKDEIINLVSDHKDEISPKENRTRVTISGVIEDLLNRKRLVADREGKLSIVIAGGSTNSPDEENLPNLKWSLPANVIGEFDEILTNEHDPAQRKKLIAFHTFMEFASSPTDFEKRLLEAKKGGVFDTAQYTKLVSALKMAPSGFVPEPPPVVAQKIKSNPNVIMSDRPAVRIDTPLSFEDIKRMREKNPVLTIREERKSEPVAGEKSAVENLGEEMSRLAHAEVANKAVAEKLNEYIDLSERPLPLKDLRSQLSLARTNEEMTQIIKSSVLRPEKKSELLALLGVSFDTPEPPPVVGQEPILVEDPVTRVKSLNERMSAAVVAAKPYDVSIDTIKQFSDTWHKEPIGPVNKPPEKSFNQRMREAKQKAGAYNVSENSLREMYKDAPEHGPARKEDLSPEESARVEGELRARLDATREDFVYHEAEYKQKLRKKKSMFRRVMEDLSAAEKQLPNMPEKDPEHMQAEGAYLDAQWVLYNFISGRETKPRPVEGSVEGVSGKKIDIGAANQAESEWDILQREIIKATPAKERSVILSAFAKWNSYPLPARIALSTALLTAGGVALGTIGVSGALAAGALRFGRAFAGAQAGLGAGKWFDGVKRKEVEKKHSERLDQHGTEDESVNIRRDKQAFIEKNKEFAQGAEAEKKTIQRNQLVKAGIMAATGGVTTVGLGMSLNAAENILSTPEPKGSFLDKFVKTPSPVESVPAPKVSISIPEKIIEAPTPEVYPNPVAVPLSNKGFIDTVGQLKQATEGQKLTPALERILNQTPQKIAMDLGLYKPGQVEESAFGYQNEKLSIDINGNLSLEHTGGNEVLVDSKGTLKPFAGKMFDADKTSTSPLPIDAVEVPVAPKVAEVIPQTPKPVAEAVPEVAPVEIKSSVSKFDVAADVITPATALVEVKPGVPLEFDQTVIKSPEYTGPQDMISGKLPLKPEYQFDPQYKPERTTYNIRLEKELMSIPANMFDLRFPIEYNGGRINVFQKGNDLLILLNGQKIGTGLMIDGQPGLQYEKSLGTGVFGVKSDFEKAFETAEKAIMKNKMFFKKP